MGGEIQQSPNAIYKDTINNGLAKFNKYYSQFDEKLSYVLALVLHPYYKLSYIACAWGVMF